MQLGTEHMRELGNLYTAALPAWVAAGLTDAAERQIELAGSEVLLVGYGSGDAADAIPMQVVAGWDTAARAIRFEDALQPSLDLNQDQYLELRDRNDPVALEYEPQGEFIVERVGSASNATFQDAGIEYYRYVQ